MSGGEGGRLPAELKIYFAGSIRGGRDDADLYACLISYLKSYGTVLTEHVGNAALLADEQAMSEEAIFERDMRWLASADLVVAEVSTPSLGVGFEIATAQAMGKDICCVYRLGMGKRLSAMISGNRQIAVCPYVMVDEVESIIASFVKQTVKRLGQTSPATPTPVHN